MVEDAVPGTGAAADRGRHAVDRREWAEAFDAFSDADTRDGDLGGGELELWATAAYLLGRVDVAVDTLGRAHRLHDDADDVAAASRCAYWLVFILMGRGDVAQASGWIERSATLLARLPEDAVERGYFLCLDGFRHVAVEHRYPEGLAVAERAIALGRAGGDRDLLVLSLNVAGRALLRAERAAEGLARLDEAMLGVVADEVSPIVAGAVYCSAIEACEEICEPGRAQEWTDALDGWCGRQRGMVTFTGRCLIHRAAIMQQRGEWDRAAAEARHAVDRLAGAADEASTGRAWYQVAEVDRLTGRFAAAEEEYGRAAEWGHDPQPGLALLRLAQGRGEEAATTMRRLVVETTPPFERTRLLPAFVEVMVAAGDLEAAGAAVDELSGLADRLATPVLEADAERAAGTLALASGDPVVALGHLRRAADLWRSVRAPYEIARTQLIIARTCEAFGDTDSAAVEAAAARRVLTELGAGVAVDDLQDGSPAVEHGLTTRELEVLRLVATGRTNRSIADDLHVAVKTVDRHVANILTKLDVPSRTAATAFAYQHDLV